MNLTTTRASIILIAAVAALGAVYAYQEYAPAFSINTATTTSLGTSTPNFGLASDGENGHINILSNKAVIKAPDFTRPLVIKDKLTDAQKNVILKEYAKIQAVLQKDPMSFNEWIAMGSSNLIVGNYSAAKEYWEYASQQWGGNYVSYNNLGDLYMNYLKDFPKAEQNWLTAINNKPDDTNPYRNLFTLYTETSYKPTNSAAEDILKKGIAANPRAVDLQVLLARWYTKIDRTADAKATYEAAIQNALRQGQTALANNIKAEAGIK